MAKKRGDGWVAGLLRRYGLGLGYAWHGIGWKISLCQKLKKSLQKRNQVYIGRVKYWLDKPGFRPLYCRTVDVGCKCRYNSFAGGIFQKPVWKSWRFNVFLV